MRKRRKMQQETCTRTHTHTHTHTHTQMKTWDIRQTILLLFLSNQVRVELGMNDLTHSMEIMQDHSQLRILSMQEFFFL